MDDTALDYDTTSVDLFLRQVGCNVRDFLEAVAVAAATEEEDAGWCRIHHIVYLKGRRTIMAMTNLDEVPPPPLPPYVHWHFLPFSSCCWRRWVSS